MENPAGSNVRSQAVFRFPTAHRTFAFIVIALPFKPEASPLITLDIESADHWAEAPDTGGLRLTKLAY